PPDPKLGHPGDIPKAATDWPELNFIIYHSCIKPRFFMGEALKDLSSGRTRNGVPDIEWTTEFAQLAAPFPNVYAELGTTWASMAVTFPTLAAHVIGQLLKFMGSDHIIFGSDSPWYGSPQWQIDAFWRFQIPEEIREQWGYPALTQADKRRILGLNAARLYKVPGAAESASKGRYRPVPQDFQSRIPDDLKTLLEFEDFVADNISKLRNEYLARGIRRRDTRYGWIRA
ncbi:MAG: amidohydrolase family protein, partial [Caldilineaceae bacterium]